MFNTYQEKTYWLRPSTAPLCYDMADSYCDSTDCMMDSSEWLLLLLLGYISGSTFVVE